MKVQQKLKGKIIVFSKNHAGIIKQSYAKKERRRKERTPI